MIIGDTKEVINKHYTKEDMNMKLQALNKFSLAMKAKSSETVPELQPDGAANWCISNLFDYSKTAFCVIGINLYCVFTRKPAQTFAY